MISVGQQLGGYTVERRIGGGQMGEVFLAQHRRIARRAAIKVLIPELSAKAAVIERFFEEARNTARISHPGIVAILDSDVQDGQAYVVMELLTGESLGTYLKRTGALGADMAFLLKLVARVADAVAAAHETGTMHRGLKPENIYLQRGEPPATAVSVKVLDFGVAQLSREDGGPSQTRTGLMLGAPAYMSPEQCRGVGRTDERSDVYALGCVFYEALCGTPPFVSPSAADLMLAQMTEAPRSPVELVPDLLPALSALLTKMLAKKPDDRPRAMSEVVESLQACAGALGIDLDGPLEPVNVVERFDHVDAAAPGTGPAPRSSPVLPPPEPARPPERRLTKTILFGEEPLNKDLPRAPSPQRLPGGKVAPSGTFARLGAMAGETVVFPESSRPARDAPRAAGGDALVPRALMGGTRVMIATDDARRGRPEKKPARMIIVLVGAVGLVALGAAVVLSSTGQSSRADERPASPAPAEAPAPPAVAPVVPPVVVAPRLVPPPTETIRVMMPPPPPPPGPAVKAPPRRRERVAEPAAHRRDKDVSSKIEGHAAGKSSGARSQELEAITDL